jgi:hypothetical protein
VRYETRRALSLRKTVFRLEFGGSFRKKNETHVETRHALSHVSRLRLTNVKPMHKTHFVQFFDSLNQRREAYLFVFLKKKSLIWKNTFMLNPYLPVVTNRVKSFSIRFQRAVSDLGCKIVLIICLWLAGEYFSKTTLASGTASRAS